MATRGTYKVLEKKSVEVSDFSGHEKAIETVREALALYRREVSRLRGWG